MKNSISKKLLVSGLIILISILLIIGVNQVVVGLFKSTSSRLVIEYNELDAIQDYKNSLGRVLISIDNFIIDKNSDDRESFESFIMKVREDLHICKNIITDRHEISILDESDVLIDSVELLSEEIFLLIDQEKYEDINILIKRINKEVLYEIGNADHLLNETKLEILEYESTINTLIKHSTITISSFGALIVLIIITIGFLLFKKITRPINELVWATDLISRGDRSAKVNVETKDEFGSLAESFNNMIETLNKTTVSRNYLNNILDNMFDALIVSDKSLKIRSINKAALRLLEYTEPELSGKFLPYIIPELTISDENIDFDEIVKKSNKVKHIKSNSGKIIPVLLSSAILKDGQKKIDGLIILFHDLTEKIAIESELEHTRKQGIINIFEAQEEERIRIATDLHDGLGQILTAISYSVQELSNNSEYSEKALDNIHHQIDLAIKESKDLAHNLIPIVMKDFGVLAAIENLLIRANDMYDIDFKFYAYDFKERINPKLEKSFYRICQESLNNIVKHSKATKAVFQIYRQYDSIILVIEDDGVGFDPDSIKLNKMNKGIGLTSMRERVLTYDGSFIINSEPGKGTELIVEVPCIRD